MSDCLIGTIDQILLWLRQYRKGGQDAANMALAVHDAFVQVCLMGNRLDGKPGVPAAEDAMQVCAHAWVVSTTLLSIVFVLMFLAHVLSVTLCQRCIGQLQVQYLHAALGR